MEEKDQLWQSKRAIASEMKTMRTCHTYLLEKQEDEIGSELTHYSRLNSNPLANKRPVLQYFYLNTHI